MKTFLLRLFAAGCMVGAIASMADVAGSEAGYLYLSPVPDASYISTQNRYILVRFIDVDPAQVTNLASFITVTGAVSGAHPGTAVIAGDGRTVSFGISQDFAYNELVTVSLNPLLHPDAAGMAAPYQYQFMVTAPMPGSWSSAAPGPAAALLSDAAEQPLPEVAAFQAEEPIILPNGVSVPSGFPLIDISINEDPDPGYIFLDNRTTGAGSYNVIFNNQGYPVWYAQWDDERRDMKVQQNGMLTMLARVGGWHFIGLDTNYVQTTEYWAVNGYSTDEHELVVLDDGTYFLIGRRDNPVNMGLYVTGGQWSTVRETVIQEFTPAGELIFQWRAWDNYDIRNNHLDSPTASYIRFPHMNAIEVDLDGNLLVSCRHQSEVTKINRDTGEVMWRLAGANSDFSFINDAFNGFSCQHSIRATETNRYILFDNGNLHFPSESRAVEYELDLSNMTASVVWEFRDMPPKYAFYMGNVQRLPNGNTLINWALGYYPKLTEVRPDGTKAFEMNWADGYEAYRTWRHPWQATALVPHLIVEPAADSVTLIFNKFGDQRVDHYRIYGGTAPGATNLLATSDSTLAHLTNVVNGAVNHFRVTAVDTNGVESGYSNEESLPVNITRPGESMIRNGDFSGGTDWWSWKVEPPAVAQWTVVDGLSHYQIDAGGSYITDILLKQEPVTLIQGEDYVFEFDAWSDQPRIFEARVEQSGGAFVNYSGIQPLTITPVNTHYRFQFTMNDPTDSNARAVFNAGISPADVYIDNVSLVQIVYAPGDFDRDGCVGYDDLKTLTDHWMEEGSPPQDLNRDGRVDFDDYVLFSANWSGDGACP